MHFSHISFRLTSLQQSSDFNSDGRKQESRLIHRQSPHLMPKVCLLTCPRSRCVSLTVACARSRSHRRSQTSGSRNIHCTFWPEIRRCRRTGELRWSALSPPWQSRLPGLIASEGDLPKNEWTPLGEKRRSSSSSSSSSFFFFFSTSPFQVHLGGMEEFVSAHADELQKWQPDEELFNKTDWRMQMWSEKRKGKEKGGQKRAAGWWGVRCEVWGGDVRREMQRTGLQQWTWRRWQLSLLR